jgi:hypothetical protein
MGIKAGWDRLTSLKCVQCLGEVGSRLGIKSRVGKVHLCTKSILVAEPLMGVFSSADKKVYTETSMA